MIKQVILDVLAWFNKQIYSHHLEKIAELNDKIRSQEKEIESMRERLDEKEKYVVELEGEIDEKIEEYNTVSNDLAECQQSKTSIQDKRMQYLDSKYGRKSFIYDKRYIRDNENKGVSLKIVDFIRPMQTLQQSNSTVETIWKEYIKYVSDPEGTYKSLDFWQFPEETKTLGQGDCDDSGIYRISKAKSNGLGQELFAALGFYNDVGHFFIVRVDENNELWVLENTSNQYNPVKYEGSAYDIYIIFNDIACWEVKGGVKFGSQANQLLKRFKIKRR